MGRLSTHVLDTAHGHPARGMEISLWRLEGEKRRHLKTAITNADGRTDEPLLEGGGFGAGVYELVFDVGAYFEGLSLPDPRFLGKVAVRFGVAHAHENYHVPLLVSPWSYSTYRGS